MASPEREDKRPLADFIVAIPTLRRYDRLNLCLQSLFRGDARPREICIVDNGGGFEPAARHPRCAVRLIRPDRNLGIAGSWNRIHELYAPADVVYCDDDIELGPDVLRALVACPDPFVSPIADRRLRWSCFLQREPVWHAVGDYDDGFWPDLFADLDYRRRMRLAGLEPTVVEGHAGIIRAGAATGWAAFDWSGWNRRRYVRKWGGPPEEERHDRPWDGAAHDELEMYYQDVCEAPSDINEHCPTLYLLAAQCDHVTEMGSRTGVSTRALLRAQPKKLVCYDLRRHPEFDNLFRLAGRTEFRFHEASTLDAAIEATDLLFIDTYHVYEQLREELELHGDRVRRFIAMHDTTTFGERGECEGSRGLWLAVQDYLAAHPEWRLVARYHHNHGLTILERRDRAGRSVVATSSESRPSRDSMSTDFRILTTRGDLRVSRIPRRAEAIFTRPVSIGLVVGTFAAVPYVHLQLEARRRFYPHVPLLVHDDGSPRREELRRLCSEYDGEFEGNDRRCAVFIGDVSCVLGGLLWAERGRLDLVVKMSRRFLPLRDWTPELEELALDSQYPTYSNVTETFGFGFRSECMGMAVKEWIADRAPEQLAMIALAAGSPFVEAVLHNMARRLAHFRCERALRWDAARGPRPDDRDGYAPWEFMGTDRGVRYPGFLWHDSSQPEDYYHQAREWGLPYSRADFLDPNQGFGSGPE